MIAAGWCRASAATPPPRAERWGSPFFCNHRFERLDVQRLLCDDLLKSAILVLELLQPLHFAQLHSAVLGLPAVIGLLGDPMRPAHVRHFAAGFAFLHDRQD